MLENYEKLKNGVIKQINVKKIEYNYDYSAKYNNYGEKGNYLAHLRLGVIIGSLGKIPQSVLDVGYGNGDFLKACSQIIPNCYGCDLSSYPVPENCTKINSLFDSHYDVITFFDSLEHFDEINFIDKLNCDYIVITLPWCHHISKEWFEKWYHRRENEHLYHFNKDALINFFDENGYDNISITNFEDTIRKNKSIENGLENILCGVFKKRY